MSTVSISVLMKPDHRKVCQFLNDYCGSRKKARYIVKAVLAYWTIENKSIEQIAQKPVFSDQPKEQTVPLAPEDKNEEDHFVSIDGASCIIKNVDVEN